LILFKGEEKMRKYILAALTFMMFACTLGGRQAKPASTNPAAAITKSASVMIVIKPILLESSLEPAQ